MNGLCYDLMTSLVERRLLAPLREELLSPLTGRIVEVGAGTGRSFSYYDGKAHVLAFEPDRSMARRAALRARSARARIDLLSTDDRGLDSLDSRSADAVVCHLVLCTIDDPALALRRMRRILKDSGKLIVLEHVRSSIARIAGFQDILAPFWRKLMCGCRINRDTKMAIAQAGFEVSGLQHRRVSPIGPIQDILFGEAAPIQSNPS